MIAAVVRHIANVYESSTSNNEEDYCARQDGEIISQVYPFFPILRERAVYKRDCRIQDEKQLRDSCQKDFPSHSKLTPGLYLLTCGCQQKSVYGFSMMMSGESPAMLFDLIMTRFENDYEYGYNRELRRFMKLTITTDRFHQCNHSTCSDSFKSSEYSALNNVNSEACEQVNALLRKISSSTTYMSPKMYIKAITLFLADQNFNSKRRK